MSSDALLRSRRIGLLCLAVTASGWGLNWPVMKLILREWPPLFARGTAGVVAALGLATFAALRSEHLTVPPARHGASLHCRGRQCLRVDGFLDAGHGLAQRRAGSPPRLHDADLG